MDGCGAPHSISRVGRPEWSVSRRTAMGATAQPFAAARRIMPAPMGLSAWGVHGCRLRRRELPSSLPRPEAPHSFLGVTPTTTARRRPRRRRQRRAAPAPARRLEGRAHHRHEQVPEDLREAPELAALVQQGSSPVADRIGQDPLVYKPVHEIGKYGGILHKSFLGTQDGTALRQRTRQPPLFTGSGRRSCPTSRGFLTRAPMGRRSRSSCAAG